MNTEDTDTTTDTDTYQGPSTRARDKINKILAEDKAQAGRTWSYYETMRKKDNAKYRSPKIQGQMEQDALDLGEAFQDGGFNG